jgi:hypothetical protein
MEPMSEATPDTIEIPAESVGVTKPVQVRRKPNKKRARVQVDHRYAAGRRILTLTTILRQRVGIDEANPDPLLEAAVEKAARLMALAEDASARALRADPKVSLDDVVRLQRMSDLALRRLRLDQHRAPTEPSLADYLRGHGGAP